ncbi:MAG: hypothetical protein AAB444_03065 [Patescibacteria group bacterium]|mgnify:CR=1 FL=1
MKNTGIAPIKIEKNRLLFAKEFLQTDAMGLWVGFGFDPLDNHDERVKRTRELMGKYYAHVPYGMNVGNRAADGSMKPVEDADNDDYFEVDVSWWPEGVYRLNYHSLPGVASSVGTAHDIKKRDQDVSWPQWWKDWDKESQKLARPFMHREKNGEGSCFRILIRPDRTIEPFGDARFDL